MSRFNFGKRRQTAGPAREYTPTTISIAPGVRTVRKKSTLVRPLVVLPGDRAIAQDASLPVLRGQAGLRAEPDSPGADGVRVPGTPTRGESPVGITFVDGFQDFISSPSKTYRSARQKKETQAKNWLEKVIPQLVVPFMDLMSSTQDLRHESATNFRTPCTCAHAQIINVLVVRFNKIEELQVPYCSQCQSVAVQLVRNGLFPCAPFRPSLAVDMRVLDFVRRLFLRIAPNHTAWCGALEEYLRAQGYRMQGTDPLRRRFANALMWFNSLHDAVTAHVQDSINRFRMPHHQEGDRRSEGEGTDDVQGREQEEEIREERETDDLGGSRNQREPPVVNTKRTRAPSLEESDRASAQERTRASEYLRSKCPLCFGSTTPSTPTDNGSIPTVVVCVDTCFTQKHNDQKGKDPCRVHPDTMFISPDKVKEMEEYVESIRSSRPSKRSRVQEDEDDDCIETGMKVPKSALDGCNSSFEAANGTAKSRANGYDERALAGMFCPHGSCLFLVTMNSLGEKQHYILVMLEALFEQIPRSWTVGFLYDVACQVERSCRKWGFLPDYMNRILWGVSVFHAYGHEWACQLVYHPRKCKGFGLCDGETCERCWHAISRLIAYTRVAGYYVRLYTLDSQFLFNNQQVLLGAGNFLRRKMRICQDQRVAAQEVLDKAGQPLDVLRAEWRSQVKSQTKPLPRQRKTAAKSAVEETLRLRKNVEVLENRVRDLEILMTSEQSTSYQRAMAEDDLLKAKSELKKARQKSSRQESSLGFSERQELKHLMNSPFLTKRMNARSIKIRLRERLRARKFEFDRLERSYRKQQSEQRLDNHTREAIQRREPGIANLATKYNKLCDEMAELIRRRKAPRSAVVPKKIDRTTLFDLDMDEEIWQDVGLGDDDVEPPLWLCNEDVRKGIRAMLEVERCDEEMTRLRMQRRALQEWFIDEWNVINKACDYTGEYRLKHQLDLRRKYLLKLYAVWEKPLVELSDGLEVEWGPSLEEIAVARVEMYTDAVEIDNGDFDVAFEEEADTVLVERLDTFDVVDSFRGVGDEDV
ncbi:hypothetical protein K435DRAFT_655068 [Dendrothele bispora CBS 962.96]|uniref:CxC2-like cysteine cluster KDZ transposase-associated domain-containing protein n=1 Tax=Dendrothele bispora (strain CBS 962.96) TaxID=1314807 RepID=A0A4S8MGE6_DENBC|nr:hypothetical protein K435DRAFT_655068 [Dendrothele bispora CBS 962.96]